MNILTYVSFIHVRFATDVEKEKEGYIVRDGMINSVRGGYTKLEQSYTITLQEIRDIYNKVVAKSNLKEGERIKSLKVDLTRYYRYNEDGTPIFASEEYPISHDRGEEKTATYNSTYNRLIIWECGYPIYENCDGDICTDRAALADTYL